MAGASSSRPALAALGAALVVAGLSGPGRALLAGDAACDFWLHDTPPLCGRARCAFYAALLAAALLSPLSRPPVGDSPLSAPALVARTAPQLLACDAGLLGLLCAATRRRPGPGWARPLCALRAVALAAWLLCIAGAGGRTPPAVLAVSVLALSLVSGAAIGVSHRWLAPVLALCCLALADGRADFSADAVLARAWPGRWPFPPPPGAAAGLGATGLATKLCLLIAVHTLFAGGVSKLLNSGPRWCDGGSLAFYMRNTPAGGSPSLKRLLCARPALLAAMACGAVAFELAAPVALAWSAARPAVVAHAALFHAGIWATARGFLY